MHMIFKKRISKEGYKVTVSLLSVSALGINIISNFLYVLPDILVHWKYVFFFFLQIAYVNIQTRRRALKCGATAYAIFYYQHFTFDIDFYC